MDRAFPLRVKISHIFPRHQRRKQFEGRLPLTPDASLCSLADLLGRDLRVEVQRHEPLDVGLDTLQLLLVLEHALSIGQRRNEVGLMRSANAGRSRAYHNVGRSDTALGDVRRHELAHGSLADMDVVAGVSKRNASEASGVRRVWKASSRAECSPRFKVTGLCVQDIEADEQHR